jgi:hypothetical protein
LRETHHRVLAPEDDEAVSNTTASFHPDEVCEEQPFGASLLEVTMDLRPDDWQMLRERIERLERSNLRLKLIPVVSAVVLLGLAALAAAQRAGAPTPRRLATLQTSRLDIVDAQGRRRVSLGLEDVTQSDGDHGTQTRWRSGQVPALIFFSADGHPLSSLKLTLDEDTELDLVAEGSALKLSSHEPGT